MGSSNMLGRLLEFSLTARPIAPALEFYETLGFETLPGGELLSTPHVAVWDGTASIGLHDHASDGVALTFVRPELASHLRALRRAGIELTSEQLGEDRFNEASFSDPNGQRVVLLEARTSSPGVWHAGRVPVCGKLIEYSLATHSIEESCEFWERVGLVRVASGDAPHDWARLEGHGLRLGLHRTSRFEAALSYYATDIAARADYLEARGIEVRRGVPLGRRDSAVLPGPCDLPIFLLDTIWP